MIHSKKGLTLAIFLLVLAWDARVKACNTEPSGDNRCEGVLCKNGNECQTGNCFINDFKSICSKNSSCASTFNIPFNRCNGVFCVFGSHCESGLCASHSLVCTPAPGNCKSGPNNLCDGNSCTTSSNCLGGNCTNGECSSSHSGCGTTKQS